MSIIGDTKKAIEDKSKEALITATLGYGYDMLTGELMSHDCWESNPDLPSGELKQKYALLNINANSHGVITSLNLLLISKSKSLVALPKLNASRQHQLTIASPEFRQHCGDKFVSSIDFGIGILVEMDASGELARRIKALDVFSVANDKSKTMLLTTNDLSDVFRGVNSLDLVVDIYGLKTIHSRISRAEFSKLIDSFITSSKLSVPIEPIKIRTQFYELR